MSRPAISAIAHWYEKKRGTMMGLLGVCGALGAIVLPIALNQLKLIVGFPWVRIMSCRFATLFELV